MMEKFIIKFSMLANEIEQMQKRNPHIIGSQITEKLVTLKKDIALLSRDLKNADLRSADKISGLEEKCEKLSYEANKLKEEVNQLIALNTELHLRLNETQDLVDKTPLNVSSKNVDKVNSSLFYATEERAGRIATENTALHTKVEALKNENKTYFDQVECLRENLDQNIKKLNEVVNEKLQLEEILREQLKEGQSGENLAMQITKLRHQEVRGVDASNNTSVESRHWRKTIKNKPSLFLL